MFKDLEQQYNFAYPELYHQLYADQMLDIGETAHRYFYTVVSLSWYHLLTSPKLLKSSMGRTAGSVSILIIFLFHLDKQAEEIIIVSSMTKTIPN